MLVDVFNGDADGITSVLQFKKHTNSDSKLITGVKRDIDLLRKIDINKTKELRVFDISLEKNLTYIKSIIKNKINTIYFDHHKPGNIPKSKYFEYYINTRPTICTSLLVSKYFADQYLEWAIVGAYGDNLIEVADKEFARVGKTMQQRKQLHQLGKLINYNGYGLNIDDLHFDPADLVKALMAYSSPYELVKDSNSPFHILKDSYSEDLFKAEQSKTIYQSNKLKVIVMHGDAWANRISGEYGNILANKHPNRAHIILTELQDEYRVSIRSPKREPFGAFKLAQKFPSGGGREGAAGINFLEKNLLDDLLKNAKAMYEKK